MRRSVQRPIVGQVARYEGYYAPHWEIAHIEVRVSRIRRVYFGVMLGVGIIFAFQFNIMRPIATAPFVMLILLLVAMPAKEWWSPRFPSDFELDPNASGGPIVFDGIVTKRGLYGHRGLMRRRVEIVSIVDYRPSQMNPT